MNNDLNEMRILMNYPDCRQINDRIKLRLVDKQPATEDKSPAVQ